jgi:hypothetical protein
MVGALETERLLTGYRTVLLLRSKVLSGVHTSSIPSNADNEKVTSNLNVLICHAVCRAAFNFHILELKHRPFRRTVF